MPETRRSRARALLRKLRDLNLAAYRIAVDGGDRVSVDGCLSLDAPVEQGVRYRLRTSDGVELLLTIMPDGDELTLSLDGPGAARRRRIELVVDESGRAASAQISARLHPESSEPRDVEHFLRRIVRGVYAA